MWKRAYKKYKETCTGPEFEEWYRTFVPEGRPYEAGEIICLPNHADTLEAIAFTEADAFYKGDLARQIDAGSKKSDCTRTWPPMRPGGWSPSR